MSGKNIFILKYSMQSYLYAFKNIYEHSIYKQDWKRILNIVLGVKYQVDFWLLICYVC